MLIINNGMKQLKSYIIGVIHLSMFFLGATIRLETIKYPSLLMLIPKAMLIYVLFKAL
jgi:hypothetical protein